MTLERDWFIKVRSIDGVTIDHVIVDEVTTVGGDDDNELSHVSCCVDEDVALCGVDVSGDEFDEDVVVTCIVCAYIEDLDSTTPTGHCVGCPMMMRREVTK